MAERVDKSVWRNRFNSISTPWNTTFSIAMILLAVFTLAPLVLVVIVSFSSSLSIARNGYTFFPSEFSLDAYKYLLKTGSQVRDSYLITIFYTVAGTALSLFVMSMYAFVLSQKRFHAQKFYTYVLFFTMLFSGGLVPSYILNVRYLHMYDTIWIFLLPSLIGAYNCIILRTFINTTIPDALFEAARIDGASNFRVYLQIVLPYLMEVDPEDLVQFWSAMGACNEVTHNIKLVQAYIDDDGDVMFATDTYLGNDGKMDEFIDASITYMIRAIDSFNEYYKDFMED